MTWPALSEDQLRARVFDALGKNRSYRDDSVLGLPGSYLDRTVFPPLPELAGFPLLATFVANPNHIGCHTLGASEPAFRGTHALERDVVRICAEEILGAEPGTVDGYVATGGTESNIQALWSFRNRWRSEGVTTVGVLASSDTHYSIAKAGDLLGLPVLTVPVDERTRRMRPADVRAAALDARARGLTHLVVVLNMGTTMFGSVDEPDPVLGELEALAMPFLVHVDGAFGGFIHPLVSANRLDFRDPRITSVTLDAHKMLQAPYGTGIHLVRKGFVEHVLTPGAAYVPGLDCTLAGSRSGTNAVAVWMILNAYGREGGEAFCAELVARTDRLCAGLRGLGVETFREPGMNLVALRATSVPTAVAERHQLVPDDHERPSWWKIVVMDHVSDALVDAFLADLERGLSSPAA
ncbi:MAG: aspartate aminotransferase family protein [Alphaproteobacteria bacterium]|nr:aspartate aminotransferase family protein [Alphaproteobacteria bacterium]